jgi:thiol-disulfide isomerase/thioredoxin
VVRIDGLAGGTYLLHAEPRDLPKYARSRTPFLYDKREIKIKPGAVNRIKPVYPEIDTRIEEGDVMIQGIVYDPEKNPLPNRPVKLIPYDSNGPMWDLYYPVCLTDSNGRFEFAGVRPNLSISVECDNRSISLGKDSLRADRTLAVDLVVGSQKLSTKSGQPLHDIRIEWKDGSAGKISDFAGKVVVLDIWATWCPPCLRALPKVNALAESMSQNKEVVFVALSVDADRNIWKQKTDASDWNALRHGWFCPKKNSLVISKPIPFCVILDEKGIICSQGTDLDIAVELGRITKLPDQQDAGATATN